VARHDRAQGHSRRDRGAHEQRARRRAESPEVSGRLAEDGVIAKGGTSEAFMATIRAEVERWQTFIKRTGIKLE
jgi:tripartite-type tricarboxylate transporter receptor subunit TctC